MLDQKMLNELKVFIDFHLNNHDMMTCYSSEKFEQIIEDFQESDLEDFINRHRQPTFKDVLFNFIENKGVQLPREKNL